jgi:hypothetical protein
MSITKTFTDAVDGSGYPLESWTVEFGDLPPSLAAFLRKLTDSRLS